MIPRTMPEIIVDLLHRIEELERRFENRERTGTIAEVDAEKGLARVKLGEGKDGKPFLSPWLPWEMPAMGATKINVPPSVGQQVKISSESGDLTEGVVRSSLRSDENPLPAAQPGEGVITTGDTTIFFDGSNIRHTSPRIDLNPTG